jgi:hypothetical protein
MRSHPLRRASLVALLALLGCSDATAPAARSTAGPGRGLISGLLQVSVLQRLTPLPTSYTASAVIGPAGGVIRIPDAGFSITFPAGAVSAPVTVRATAIAGRDVAYRLEPHGLVFAAQPVITQDLSLTEVVQQLLLLSQVMGGYYPDDASLANGTAMVSETQAATTSLLPLRMSFRIRHFSGYVAARPQPGGYISSSGARIPMPPGEAP